MVEVPLVVGDVLEVPDDLAGVGVEGERGVGVQDVAVAGAALHRAPRDRHPDAGEDEVQLGVEAGRVPGRAAPPVLVGNVSPALVAELAPGGNGVRAPHLGAGVGVVGRHPTAGVEVIAAGHAGDDASLDHHRAARVVLADGPVADRDVPLDLAGPGVQGDEVGVVGGDEQLVVVEGAVAVDAGERRRMLDPLPPVLPEARAVAHVEGLDEVARLHQEHHPVVHERGRLLPALSHGPGPRETQAADVGRVYLVKRTVPPVAVGPPPHRPVARRRSRQHVPGHRRVAVGDGLRRGGRPGEQEADQDGAEPQPRHDAHVLSSRGGLARRCPAAVPDAPKGCGDLRGWGEEGHARRRRPLPLSGSGSVSAAASSPSTGRAIAARPSRNW